jgi:hypothetical protein
MRSERRLATMPAWRPLAVFKSARDTSPTRPNAPASANWVAHRSRSQSRHSIQLFSLRARIAQFTALRYFVLDGTDHRTHQEQGSMIRRYIAWRNRNAESRELRRIINRANVA